VAEPLDPLTDWLDGLIDAPVMYGLPEEQVTVTWYVVPSLSDFPYSVKSSVTEIVNTVDPWDIDQLTWLALPGSTFHSRVY
jgi:hypothetical protein